MKQHCNQSGNESRTEENQEEPERIHDGRPSEGKTQTAIDEESIDG